MPFTLDKAITSAQKQKESQDAYHAKPEGKVRDFWYHHIRNLVIKIGGYAVAGKMPNPDTGVMEDLSREKARTLIAGLDRQWTAKKAELKAMSHQQILEEAAKYDIKLD
tara:strand:+ start:206 stop:532 length:327 start_codon:yes stop_codon:yes gene_type:complete